MNVREILVIIQLSFNFSTESVKIRARNSSSVFLSLRYNILKLVPKVSGLTVEHQKYARNIQTQFVLAHIERNKGRDGTDPWPAESLIIPFAS